ncbi:hypothetical protein F5Y13DRAFT_194831 [Hypoxylon sp. FL1857]|nr:hypothetical protein F5Y13DRAFT_194831 [Hypoxylon sp. FL1857]
MRFSNIFVTILSGVASMAQAFPQGPIGEKGLPPSYSESNLTWTGTVTKNGPKMSFNGSSFEDIEAQIHRMNPDFSWDDQDVIGTPVHSTSEKAHLTCDPNNIWWAQVFRINQGIEYLKGKTGTCSMGPGPRVCTRISCSYKSAIWWCNDNDYSIEEDCSIWANYAQDIVDQCQTHDATARVRGQEFSTDNWNIMVGFDNDHC